jgi:hypothetical protein
MRHELAKRVQGAAHSGEKRSNGRKLFSVRGGLCDFTGGARGGFKYPKQMPLNLNTSPLSLQLRLVLSKKQNHSKLTDNFSLSLI